MTDPTSRPSDEPLGALAHRLSEQIPELAFFGVATLITTAILALALVLPPWAAALIIAVVLLAGAGGAALAGRNEVQAAAPPTPERTISNVREDVSVLKGGDA